MIWWSEFFDSLLFSNMLRCASLKVSCCLHSSSSSLKEFLCLLICSASCSHLDFDTVLTVNQLIALHKYSLFIYFLKLGFALVDKFAMLRPWLVKKIRIDQDGSTWSDLLCCIPVLSCTWVRFNAPNLFIYFFI